jgi:hypothetical protein
VCRHSTKHSDDQACRAGVAVADFLFECLGRHALRSLSVVTLCSEKCLSVATGHSLVPIYAGTVVGLP